MNLISITNKIKTKLFTPSKVSKINELNNSNIKRSLTHRELHSSDRKRDFAQCIKNTRITLNDLSLDKPDKEVRISHLEIEEEKNINISLDSTLNIQDVLFMNGSSFNRSNIFEKSFMNSVNQNRLTACWISISK
jgi:hypothetical protein